MRHDGRVCIALKQGAKRLFCHAEGNDAFEMCWQAYQEAGGRSFRRFCETWKERDIRMLEMNFEMAGYEVWDLVVTR